MKIGLLLAGAERQRSISAYLGHLGYHNHFHAERLDDLPQAPWPDMILLADWALLSSDERAILLNQASEQPCLALIIIAPFLSGEEAGHMLHSKVADILNSAADLPAMHMAVHLQCLALHDRRQWLDDQDHAAEILHHLTPREQDILRALHGGASNKAAARLLGISPRTVEVHRANMLRRTGLACLSDLLKVQIKMDQARAMLRQRPYGLALDQQQLAPDSSAVNHPMPSLHPWMGRDTLMRWN